MAQKRGWYERGSTEEWHYLIDGSSRCGRLYVQGNPELVERELDAGGNCSGCVGALRRAERKSKEWQEFKQWKQEQRNGN